MSGGGPTKAALINGASLAAGLSRNLVAAVSATNSSRCPRAARLTFTRGAPVARTSRATGRAGGRSQVDPVDQAAPRCGPEAHRLLTERRGQVGEIALQLAAPAGINVAAQAVSPLHQRLVGAVNVRPPLRIQLDRGPTSVTGVRQPTDEAIRLQPVEDTRDRAPGQPAQLRQPGRCHVRARTRPGSGSAGRWDSGSAAPRPLRGRRSFAPSVDGRAQVSWLTSSSDSFSMVIV